MKRIGIAIAFLAAVLMSGSAWANSYYAKASVAKVGSGSGTVYISPSSGATSGVTSIGDKNPSFVQTGMTGGGNVAAYFYAIPAAGSSFKGWSKTSGQTDLGQGGVNGELKQNLKTATKGDNTNDNGTWYALFEKNPDVVVTFNAPVAGQGTYTATDGTTTLQNSGEISTPLPITLTAKAATGYRHFGWYTLSGDTKTYFSYAATAEYTPTVATTIGVDFIAESEVVRVSDLEALKTALVGSSPVIELSSAATVVVPSGETLTVPAGKLLAVEGKLAVMGALNVVGLVDGAGKVLRVTKIVTQGPVITPANTYTEYPSHRYRKTETADNTPTLSGTAPQCTVSYGVSVTGLGVFEMSSASPKILKVTFDTSVALNSIKSVTGSTDTTTASEPYLLLADANLNAPVVLESSKYNRLRYTSTLDCAGHKCTVSDYQVSSSFNGKFLNGTVEYTGEYWQQGSASFYNCGSVAMKKLKGAGNKFYYYDCGTMASPASVSFTYYSGTRTTDFRNAYFYSGVYEYTFSAADDTGMFHVYGGSFNKDPSAYLETTSAAPDGLEAPGPVDGYYTVYAKEPPLELVKIGDTAYTSLQKAITAAEPGAKLLLNGLNELSGTVTVPAGKQLTIDLNGFTLTGGILVNEGALRFEDNSGQALLGTLSSSVVNNGNGTIDIAYGTYAGTFTVNGGTLTTHEGTFTETFAAVENGGTVALKGGSYAGAITVPEGYKIEGGKLGEVIRGDMNPNNPIPAAQADFSYTVRGLPDDDQSWTLYSRFKQGTVARSAYTDAEWDRLSELRSAIEPIESRAIEATLVFDRPVAANSFSGVAKIMGVTRDMPIDRGLAANEEFHVLIPLIEGAGYTAKSYKFMFDGSEGGVWGTLLCGGKNHSVANIGTTCTLKFQLRISERAPDYTTQNQHHIYTFYDIASQSYTFAGKGAIFGDTDYTSLTAALVAANYAGSVLLSKDCVEQVPVSRPTTFVLDSNGFAFTGAIIAGDGFELTTEDLGDGKTRYTIAPAAVAQVGADKYTSLEEALAAAQTSGEPVLVLGPAPETPPEGFTSIVVNEKTLLVPESAPEVVVQAPDAADFPDGVAATVKDQVVAAGPVAVITGTGVLDEEVCPFDAVLAALKAVADLTETERAQITAASEIRRYVSVQLTAVEVTAAAAFAGLSFDVKPMAKTFVIGADGAVKVVVAQIPNTELKGGITFRLPLTDAFTTSARIVHALDPDRLVRVEVADGKRYAAVTATHFSVFTAYPDSHVESAVSSSNVLAVKRVPGGTAAEVVAAVPWRNVALTDDVTVDRLIATGVATGDEIAAWNHENKTYYTWCFNGTAWESATDARTGVAAPAASETTLLRGQAVWYKRATPSAAYSQVGGYTAEAVATTVTLGGRTSANKPANTLLINPYYEAVDLAKIDGGHGDQIQVLPSLKVYSRNNGQWGVVELVTVDSPFGPIKQQQFNAVSSIVLPAGQGFWYISKGGQPTIDWKSIKPTAE